MHQKFNPGSLSVCPVPCEKVLCGHVTKGRNLILCVKVRLSIWDLEQALLKVSRGSFRTNIDVLTAEDGDVKMGTRLSSWMT